MGSYAAAERLLATRCVPVVDCGLIMKDAVNWQKRRGDAATESFMMIGMLAAGWICRSAGNGRVSILSQTRNGKDTVHQHPTPDLVGHMYCQCRDESIFQDHPFGLSFPALTFLNC